ncbi:MAG TPA: DUF4145 domain-containing protein, partial [Caulobacteraceae bacterium]
MLGKSANFGFLEKDAAQLYRLAALAEHYFPTDANTCLFKLRQFAELLAQEVAARTNRLPVADETFADLLRRLRYDRAVPREAGELFHQLRVLGNSAAHDGAGTHAEALFALKMARELAVWFHRAFGGAADFKAGPFTPPRPPPDPADELRAELATLSAALAATQTESEKARAEAEARARALLAAEERARKEADDRVLWEQLAQESDDQLRRVSAELAGLQ